METVRIDTPQNVAIEYDVATLVDRGLAAFMDWLLLAAYSILLYLVLFKWLELDLPDWLAIILFSLPWTLYQLVFELTMDGRSLGKRVRNIKVARLDGGQPGLGHYLMRWTLRPVDLLLFIGSVVIIFNGKGQRLGDIAAGTTVISLKQRVRLAETLVSDMPAEHEPTFPEAAHLSDRDARLVRRVLRNTSERRPMLVAELAGQVRDKLAVDTQIPPEPFLEAVLQDYVYLTGR